MSLQLDADNSSPGATKLTTAVSPGIVATDAEGT